MSNFPAISLDDVPVQATIVTKRPKPHWWPFVGISMVIHIALLVYMQRDIKIVDYDDELEAPTSIATYLVIHPPQTQKAVTQHSPPQSQAETVELHTPEIHAETTNTLIVADELEQLELVEPEPEPEPEPELVTTSANDVSKMPSTNVTEFATQDTVIRKADLNTETSESLFEHGYFKRTTGEYLQQNAQQELLDIMVDEFTESNRPKSMLDPRKAKLTSTEIMTLNDRHTLAPVAEPINVDCSSGVKSSLALLSGFTGGRITCSQGANFNEFIDARLKQKQEHN